MKKMMLVLLSLLTALVPLFALAADSRTNRDIPETEVVDVVPEDETQEVIPPVVEIIPDTEEVAQLQEDMRTIYRLIVYYVYADGETASETYATTMQPGMPYNVVSPEINGYQASLLQIDGVMPQRDVMYTVMYLSPETEHPAFPYSQMTALYLMDDYETPLGLGFIMDNVGICFE